MSRFDLNFSFIGLRNLSTVAPNATRQLFSRIFSTQVVSTERSVTNTLLVLGVAIVIVRLMSQSRRSGVARGESYDASITDPPLLQKHSTKKSYTTSRFTYSGIRVFYHQHPQSDQLPRSPAPLPLLVFVHGLGGSVAQFHPLLTSLTNVSSCLAVDLPGCGVSDFAPTAWEAYTTEALVELLELIIDSYREKEVHQGVVLIGHSMGCSLSVCLASKSYTHKTDLLDYMAGLVAICPSSGPPKEQQVALFRKLLWIPTPIFNLWRSWDQRGGLESSSVHRFVGAKADAEAKRLQNLFNKQSRTPVWRRMASGCLPTYNHGVPKGGLPGLPLWAELDVPVYLVGGVGDHVTPPSEVDKIVGCLKPGHPTPDGGTQSQAIIDSAAPVDSDIKADSPHDNTEDASGARSEFFSSQSQPSSGEDTHDDPSTPSSETHTRVPPLPQHPKKAVRSIILPPPATHALLYTPSTARILAGLVSDFLACHISGRLSLGWQLQYLSQEGKWDVKNLAKWEKVAPVSGPICSIFRAMKTLRELDETHSPTAFVRDWGDVVKDIVDISHDRPVYDPRGLERAGVRYHKLPTVSKIPPTDLEVDSFIALVDRLREEHKAKAKEESWREDYVIGVHCHYGFNRTGYFIVCYLVDRCGLGVREAIDAFAAARPNGIRHSHFLDKLFVRYSGLKEDDK